MKGCSREMCSLERSKAVLNKLESKYLVLSTLGYFHNNIATHLLQLRICLFFSGVYHPAIKSHSQIKLGL